MGRPINDLTGQRFGRRVVVERQGTTGRNALWRWRCDCGNEGVNTGEGLRYHNMKCGGCLSQPRTHGSTTGKRAPEYTAWAMAKQRVTNPANAKWRHYGGRGIRMADEWLHDFAAFLSHIGPRPAGMSLDRIDNDGNYEPGNVRWATIVEQNNNRRCVR